jgi:hypothetical protein
LESVCCILLSITWPLFNVISERYGWIQPMPGYSKDALWPGNPGQSRGVHGLSHTHVLTWTKQKRWLTFLWPNALVDPDTDYRYSFHRT